MAQHNVSFIVPWRDLGKANIEFKIQQDGSTLGTLYVSKGAVVWQPANAKKKYKMRWSRFDSLMQENGSKGDGA